MRGVLFLLAAIAYGGVWLAIAMLFSIYFRSTATSLLASMSLWLLFSVFWPMIASRLAEVVSPIDIYDATTQLTNFQTQQALERLSPNHLFSEVAMAILNPSTRTFNMLFVSQLQGMVRGAPLPLSQSLLLIWPQLTGLLAGLIVLFTLAYSAFQRQEVRA